MRYILEHKNENGEIKYVMTSDFTVYCPEFAASYGDRKSALTVAEKYINQNCYSNLRVVELNCTLIADVHRRCDEDFADRILFPDGHIMKRKREKRPAKGCVRHRD